MKSKKAVIEVQFNWLFIFIAGVIILIFFINIAGKYKDKSETDLSSDIVGKISAIATSGQLSSNSNSRIEVANLDLVLDCYSDTCNEFGCTSQFDFGGKGIMAPAWMDLEPVYSPYYIKGDYLVTWSLDWTMPYKVCSFLYLTSVEHKYVLVYKDSSESFAREVYSKLSENKFIEVELIEESQIPTIPYRGEQMIKFVLFYIPTVSPPAPNMEVIKSKKWDVLYINGDTQKGTANYSIVVDGEYLPGPGFPYLEMPMLIGAIYSDSVDFYKCNAKKAFLKLQNMNNIYYRRTQDLYDYYVDLGMTDYKNCKYFYQATVTDAIRNINQSIQAGDDFTLAEGMQMISDSETIEYQNQLVLSKDCPRIY